MEGRGTQGQDGETQTMPKQAAASPARNGHPLGEGTNSPAPTKKSAPHTMQGARRMCRLLAAR